MINKYVANASYSPMKIHSVTDDKYNVFYDGFASNIMPEITVIPVEQE